MKSIKIVTVVILIIIAYSCRKEVFIPGESNRPADWTTETHSNNVDPNYDVVFNQTQVTKIHIVFTAQEWADMQSNLQTVKAGGYRDEPAYFPVDFHFNGKQWYEVGIRYKGNSSLKSANSGKLPFKFNFDIFEDDFPEINNQRFYGFKKLAMGSGYKDLALMKDKTASDVFRHFGVPATRSSFYEVYIDKGDGNYQYFGSYTMNEVVEDTFLKNFFGTETGNCYKPDGTGARLGSFVASSFPNKTNDLSTDFTDIQDLITALNSSTRTSNPTLWKTDLEALFDVDGFLKYLAAMNTIQNWDCYGRAPHNYYLYNDPTMGKLRWIVWDCNLAFASGTGNRASLTFDMNEVGTSWPLINYIIDDATYKSTYKAYVKDFYTTSFATSRMSTIISSQQTLLTTSATNEEAGYTFLTGGVGSFNTAVSDLQSHCGTRVSDATNYAP
ncbi:CotH kinase family protein [bacterium]|nr:CotH kinase family protein [bacterium]MDB4088417.1 CotH kinase family protein [Flavobacteriales bacterium]